MTEHFLIFGGLRSPDTLTKYDWTTDISIIEEKLNVTFEVISQDALKQAYNALTVSELTTAQTMAERFISEANEPPSAPTITTENFTNATALYLAMNTFVQTHHSRGLTIRCHSWVQDVDSPAPCIALQLFQEHGVLAACSSDIDALMTMYLFQQVTESPSYMGNSFELCGHVGISHCVLSRFLEHSATPGSYYISDYHGRKATPTIHTLLSKGQPVTLARLTRNLETLLLTTGQILDNLDLHGRCRNTLVIQAKDTENVMKHIHHLQQHFIVTVGDHVERMATLANTKGIRVTTI